MVRHRMNCDGLPQYHLRRIGRRPSLPKVINFINFNKRVTLIGRNSEVVDYVLSSANESRKRTISRTHARVIRSPSSNQHRLVDSSITGVYVNDRRLDGDVILSEGDTVTFGHPQSSRVDRGGRVRQPNSEFHFMFELCDCEQGQGTEQGQEPRPCTAPPVQPPLILPAACPRLPAPQLLWGALPSFVPGQLWAMGEARARTSDVVALRDLGKSMTVTEVREQLAPASGVGWLPYPWCGPEQMELASRGLASTDPDARSLAAPGVPPQPPVTPTQPSLVHGDSPIIRGSTGGTYLDSHTKECSLFPPVPLTLWNGYLNGAAEGAVSGEGESSRRRLPVLEDRLRSGEARQLPSDRWEAPASPSRQDSPAGAKTMTDRRCASVPVSRFHREQNKHTGEACVAAAAFWPAGGVALQGAVSTCTTPCPNVVPGGGSTGTAQDEIQGNSAGSARCREPVAGMEWAPPMNKEPPEDTGAGDVTKATEAAEPPLGHGVTGQFKQHQGDDTLTELTVHDSTFTQEVPTVLGADTGCLSGGSVSSIGEVRGDPALSDWQAGENEFHVDDEGCQSKGGDPVTDSFRSAARWQDSASQPGLENTGETDTPAPLPQSERKRGAVRNSSEGTFVEGNSASESSFCVQTLEILEDPDKRLEDVCVSRDVPGQHSSLEGRIENGTMVDMESEENGGLHGDPQTLLGDAVCAEDALPIPMDIGLTALNGQSIEAKLDDDHLIEARATADTITDCIGTAGNGTELSSACEVQLSSDGSHICATVVDELEASNILALRTETCNSLPKDTSSALTKQMGKAGSLINSATREGFGSLVESQVAHKLEAVSVGRSEWIKEGGDGSSFVEAPAAVPDISWVKCTALDDSVPNADSFTFASETKPESRLAMELARDMDSFPITTLSTFGPSVPGVTSRDSKWPVILPGKLCSPLVGPEQGAQDQVSAAGQPTEGDCARAMPGDAVGALGDSETHRKTPRASSKVDVEDTKAQNELNLTDQRELEMDEVQEMETGVSQEMGGQRVDLRCDGKLLPLEGTTCLNVLMESEIATLGRVGLCDTCLVVTNGEETESDAKEASVMLHLSPRADPELAGDSIEKDKDMEVDPVPECAGGNVDVADVNPVAVARNTTSPDVGTVTLSTSLECDVINKPISPEPSAAAGDYMETQQEVSPPERAEAHSELELTDPLAVPPSLSECVEPDSHGGEEVGEGQLPECPALMREEGDEAVERLTPAGGPIAALVKLGTTVGPEWRTSSYTAGPPPSVASWTRTAPSPPTQTESRSQAATGEAVEQSCSEHLALEQPSHGVPSSVATGLEGEDLQFPVKPQESENLLRGGEVSDGSLVGQKAEANPFSVPEAGEGLNKVDGEPAEERYLVSEYLTTRTVPGATAELGGHREDFTDTGKTELSSNSIEDGGKFHLSKDCGPGVSSQAETCKSEKTEGGERELCSAQWMRHGALGVSDTEDLSSVPSDGCSQAMEPETEGSPLTAVRTVPLGCWTTTKVWQCRVGGLVALRCPGRVLACENIMDTKGEPCSLEGPTVSVGGADAPVPQGPTVSVGGADAPVPQGPTVSEWGADAPVPQGPTVSVGGADAPVPHGPTVSEWGADAPVPQSAIVSVGGADAPVPHGPTVSEWGADVPVPQSATVSVGGADAPVPQSATVSVGGADVPVPQSATVSVGGADVPVPQSATVSEWGADAPVPQSATVSEWGADVPVPQSATVSEWGADVPVPQSATVSEWGADAPVPQSATVSEWGADAPVPQSATVSEWGADAPVPQSATVSEWGADAPVPQSATVSEWGADAPVPQSATVSEWGADAPVPQSATVSEWGADAPVPHGPTVSEWGADTSVPQSATVSEWGADTSVPQSATVSEWGADAPVPHGPTVSEWGADTSVPQSATVSEGEANLPTLQDPTVSEQGADPPTSQDLVVAEGGASTLAPRSPTVSKMGASISTWPCPTVSKQATNTPMLQGSTVAKGGTDIPTLEDPTVPEGGTNVTSMWVPTLSEQGANILSSQGPAVAEGGADNTAPQGPTVTEGGTDNITPQGPTVTEGGTDNTDLQGPTEGEANTSTSQDPAAQMVECFGKEALVAAGYRGGNGAEWNRALLGGETLLCEGPLAVTVAETTAEQRAATGDPEWHGDIVPDEWLLASETQLPLDVTLGVELELSGTEECELPPGEAGGCLAAGFTDQLERSVATAEEATRIGVKKSQGSGGSHFPSDCMEMGNSAELVEGRPADPSDLQRADLQEDAARGSSPGAKKDEERPGDLAPGLSDTVIGHLQYQGRNHLEALAAAGVGRGAASAGMEQAEGEQRGSGHLFDACRPVESNELLARDDSSDVGANGCVLETELHCVCPADPDTREERAVHSPVTSSAVAPASVQEASEVGSTCKALTGGGEKPIPGGSGNQGLVDEGHEETKEPPAPQWRSGPSPSWASVRQEEPLRTPSGSDSQRLELWACTKAVLPLALVKSQALETERTDGWQGESLDEKSKLVTDTAVSVGLGSPCEMGQEAGGGSIESDDSLADFAASWCNGWLLSTQVPDNSKNDVSGSEQGEGLSTRADRIDPITEPNQIVTGLVTSSSTDPAIGAGADLGQILTAEEPNGHNLVAKEVQLDTCPQTEFPKAMSVSVEEPAEDLQFEDQRSEENGDSGPAPVPRESDHHEEQPGFSKEAEVGPRGIAKVGKARELCDVGEFGIEMEMGTGATEGTLGEKGVCVSCQFASQIMKQDTGAIKTPLYHPNLAHNSRDTDKSLQQQLVLENPNEDPLKGCRPPSAEGQPNSGSLGTCVFEQANQEGKVIQHISLSEGKDSLFPEAPVTEVFRGKPTVASVDRGWPDVDLETMEGSQRDLGRNEVEAASGINVELGLVADSTDIKLSPGCLILQLSESKSEEEGIAGSWSSNGSRHLGTRALKRPHASEVADLNSTATGPSKRKCTPQQSGAVGLQTEERIKLSLQSFSKQLKQHRANYIGRMVRQFFAEYRQSWKRRVPKLAVVNRRDEVARIVEEFFKTLSVESKANAVVTSQQSMTSSSTSQWSTCSGSELGQGLGEDHESFPLEVSQKREEQLERPCLIGQGLALTRVTDGTRLSKTAERSLPICHSSSEISWHDQDVGDLDTFPLPEGSDIAQQSETIQESSRDTTLDLLRCSPHFGQNTGDIQIEGDSATEGFGPSFCFTQNSRVYTEKAEAPSTHEMGPLSLPPCSSIAESPEEPVHDQRSEYQSLTLKGTSYDVGGTEEMSCDGRESLLLETPNTPCSSTLVENVKVARTDWRSSSSPAQRTVELAEDGVAAVLYDGRSSSDALAHLSAPCQDIHPPNLADSGQMVEELSPLDHSYLDQRCEGMDGLSVVQPSAPGVDGLNAAQLGCSNSKAEPVNVVEPSALDFSNMDRNDNSVESVNVAEPSALDHNNIGCSDNKSEPVNVAEPSALDYNPHNCSNNKVEPINVMEPSAPHHRSLYQSDSKIGLSIVEPLTPDNIDRDRNDDEVEPINIAEQSALDNDDLGCSDNEIEPVNATESSALDNSDLGLSEDKVEPVNIAEPPILDNNDLGCSDDEIEPVNATESSALDHSDLGLSEDKVEPVNIAEPPILDNNDLGCSDDEIEPVNATESSALDNSDLGLSEDEVEPVNIAGPPICDNNDLGCSDDEIEPVNATESSALDNSDLGLSEDEVEPVNIAGPPILDNNDLGCSDKEAEPVNATESSALDNSDLGLSEDEVEPVNIAGPTILDNNDLGCSDDEIEPVNATESSALDNSDLGLSEDEVEPVNIAEPPILDNNDLDQSENEVEPVNIVEPSGLDNVAPGHGDDQIEPVNVERLLLHCNNPTHSNAKIEPVNVAKQSALDRSNLDHSDNGVESVNGAELSALVHNTLTSVTGGKSAAPLGRCTEWQSIPNCLPGAGSCTAPCGAPTDCVDPWQSRGEGSVWELSDSPRPDQAGTVGCMSGRYSGREHQSSLAESLRLPASRLSVLEVKNPLRAASRNVIVEDPAWSETWSQLRLESSLRVGRISSEETPQLETPRDSIAHRGRSDIDWRAHGGFVSGSREALGVAGESLAAGGVSSVPFAEDVKTERGCAPTDGTDCSSSPTSQPSSLPRARDCSAGPVRNLYQDLRSDSPLLTDPRPVGREQPILQVVEATRLGGRGTKEVGPYSWHSTPSGPNTPACPPPPPADQSLVLSNRRRIGESGARVGDIGCERDGASLSCGNQLKAIKKERGSDREAGDCASGQWSRPTNSLPVSGCPLTTSSAVSCLTEPTAGFAHPSAASRCPTLPLDPVSWGSLEWHPARTPLESPAVGFPALWNATPPHAEVPHPQPTQSPSTQPRVKSTAALPSDPLEQSSPAPSLDQSSRADPCNVRLPRQHLPCGHDDEMSFPLAEAECPQDSKGNLDQVNSQDYTFCRLSPSCLGSDRAGLPPRRGSGSNQAEFRPPQSEWNPARRDVTVGAGCCSEGTGEGPQWSAFPEHQGEKSKETCQPSEDEAAFVPQSVEHCWASSDQDIRFQLRECNLLLQYISEALQAEGVAEKHVSEWRQTIKELEEQTVPPLTYVAVVGDTGSGKSSLLNALLDEEGVLPTSAMRACTAVVVEVSHNTSSCHYRADIEFFSEEEWNKELLSLLSDMTDKRGRLKRRRPEPGSEASVAYSRVKAVYGKILPYSELKQLREVTQYLGTTTTISQAQASEFRSKVQRFVDSRNDSSSSRGGEFWPIVKRVRVQVPNSAVLQTGAVLVDLPGIGDSNAARNSVAKEYLKTCDAVWIVANVTRAVDDKTAKETLDESLRRQLLMDGQFGRIAFICTKTDSHNVTEIMSALSMNDECSPLEAEIAKLRDQIEQRQVDRKAWRSELEWIQSSNQNGERAKQLELAIKQLDMELTDLHREKSVKQRELSLNSIRARNFFCKQKIRLNFKRGLQDLKCQARAADTDSDEEQEESDDEDADEDDDDDVHEVYPLLAEGSGPDPHLESQLPVFTVSSTEYLKLRDKLQRDGPPRVFHNIEDTEIPAVQRFVHRITLARRALGTEVVIRKLATFVSHIVNYLTNRRAQSASDHAKVREAVQDCLSRVREIFQQTAEDCSRDIENSFTIIKTHLNVGKKVAMKSCEDTVLRWGSRPPIGFPYATYKATCSRYGTFSSPACGTVDFNEELSRPLLTHLQVVWDKEFSTSVPQHLVRFKAAVLAKLEYFFSDLLQRIRRIEGDIQPINYILCQQLSAVRAKLENFAITLLHDITARQRIISRILTPAVQAGMMPAYLVCASESGPRCFDRMKSHMEQHIHSQKEQIFTATCRKLTDQLDLLKQEIHSRLKHFLDEICNELLVQFEPLLKPLRIIDEIIPKLDSICKRTTALCERSQIDFTLPKIEENDKEPEPGTFLRTPEELGTPPLQDLEKFLGKVKIMKINQEDVNPVDPIEISLDKVVLKYEVSYNLQEEPIPFQLLSACEFSTGIPFLILTHKTKRKGRGRTDVVVLDEEQTPPVFGQWMQAVADRWHLQLKFRRLEVLQGVQRLQSLQVIYQGPKTKVPIEEEAPFVWPGSSKDSSTSSPCDYADSFPLSRKRGWWEMERPGALPMHQGTPHWERSSQLSTETQTQPPVLKKEKGDWWHSGPSQDWTDRSEPPMLENELCKHPATEDLDSA